MYQYHKKCHSTHLLLEDENKLLINQVENLENEDELKTYPWAKLQSIQNRLRKKQIINNTMKEKPTFGIAVDGWCSGNPGPCGYRGVDLETGEQLFLQNHLGHGTNNIAEFIAIVHGLQFIKKIGKHSRVYSDSLTAIKWVENRKCNTDFNTSQNPDLVNKIWRCEMFLLEQKKQIIVNKWDTQNWGEIPADFGRK